MLPGLRQTFEALGGELLVVDDGSTDQTAAVSAALGATVIRTGSRLGAAQARNIGAKRARGETLVFVDADVVPHQGAIQGLLAHVRSPGCVAAFGSYDADSAERNFASLYQNLRHHYYHQQGSLEAESFWSGLGVVDRRVFLEAGGLDTAYEGIEDVEFGARLRGAGHRIRLDPSCLGTHLKRWTLWQAVHTDVFKRALPWSRLLNRPGEVRPTLNTCPAERVRAGAALVLFLALGLAALGQASWIAPATVAAGVGTLNLRFMRFMASRGGWGFGLLAAGHHQLYYLYATAVYGYCRIERLFGARPARQPLPAAGTGESGP
jgi:glycosyltransferase involved in cell wall biosynthesis